jgi:hypothetical protein
VLALAVAAAAQLGVAVAAKQPARTLTATPRSQYVVLPVRIRGKHWVVSRLCSKPVQVTVRKPTGKLLTTRSAKLKPDGSFALTWRIPRLLGGMTLRIRAVETCSAPVGGHRVFLSRTSVLALATP